MGLYRYSIMASELFDILEGALTPEVKEFAKSLFFDTRITQDIYTQILKEPKGVDQAIAIFKQYSPMAGRVIRNERPDLVDLAQDMDSVLDPLERIALWATKYKSSDQ